MSTEAAQHITPPAPDLAAQLAESRRIAEEARAEAARANANVEGFRRAAQQQPAAPQGPTEDELRQLSATDYARFVQDGVRNDAVAEARAAGAREARALIETERLGEAYELTEPQRAQVREAIANGHDPNSAVGYVLGAKGIQERSVASALNEQARRNVVPPSGGGGAAPAKPVVDRASDPIFAARDRMSALMDKPYGQVSERQLDEGLMGLFEAVVSEAARGPIEKLDAGEQSLPAQAG